MTTLFTIGYAGVQLADFIETLRQAGITRLVDCRSKPWSRQRDFTKDKLERSLKDVGIEYRWTPALGGKEGKRPEGWNEALDHVIQRAGEGLVLLCMEYDPKDCHRSKWLEPDLETRGIKVERLFAPQNKPRPRNASLDSFRQLESYVKSRKGVKYI